MVGNITLDIFYSPVSAVPRDDSLAFLEKINIDLAFYRSVAGVPTGISVGLFDMDAQPFFIHTCDFREAYIMTGK